MYEVVCNHIYAFVKVYMVVQISELGQTLIFQCTEADLRNHIPSRPLGRPYDSMFGIILTHQL
jgi:hypothetical protein